MFICEFCGYATQKHKDHKKHVESLHKGIQYNSQLCSAVFTWRDSLRRHMRKNHEGVTSGFAESVQTGFNPQYEADHDLQGVIDIRLKENFKLFVSGPSRCGKTVFVSKLLENIQSFTKQPPSTILYI